MNFVKIYKILIRLHHYTATTCKYNPLSFLPRFLYEQFRRYNNVFFLVIALLQQIPDVSPTGRYTTAVPFLIILSVSAIKEIFEDIIRVGDLLRIENNQLFPADLLLVASSEPQGMAYIETSNLDGETNLKIKQALESTSSITSLDKLSKFHAEIDCEPPSRHVNEFSGNLCFMGQQQHFGIDQLLLRGARLKNTSWIFGAIIYTGHDSRLLMNSKTAPLKRQLNICLIFLLVLIRLIRLQSFNTNHFSGTVDIKTNSRIIFLFFVLVALALISAAGAEMWRGTNLPQAWYLSFLQMYDINSDSCAVARTSNLNEELGLVKFIMSDKTGTLTRNVMKFKRISVGGTNYGDNENDEFCDESIIQQYKEDPLSEIGVAIKEILTMMAVCHTVVPENKDGEILYQSSSPDEGALVRGAANLGFVFHTRQPQKVVVRVLDSDEHLEVLDVVDFTSDRKRMSVIVRDSHGTIKLYTKGADSVIFERLEFRNDKDVETICRNHLEDYASFGYRTLCFAMKEIDSVSNSFKLNAVDIQDTYSKWSVDYREASLKIEGRQKALAEVAENIEQNLRLVGATAIEDKLQEFVPETVQALMAANIRVWMLTGDKRETAVNIGLFIATLFFCLNSSVMFFFTFYVFRFAIFSAWSGQTIFERWTIGMFNVIFTAWPPVVLGLFDRPVSAQQMMNYPSLYNSFQKRSFSTWQFSLWIGMAIVHSLSLFFLSYAFLEKQVVWENGRTGGWLMLGNCAYTFVVATVCLKAMLECDSWSFPVIFACIGSVALWLLFLFIYAMR
uniref:P-type phospholipid transporter n=1 Tax=Heterorhabditis bacteriophora TaxID=37862 RepID=A0A1I7XTK0_HETBA